MTDDQQQQVTEILQRLGSPRQHPDRCPGDYVDVPLRQSQPTSRDYIRDELPGFASTQPAKVRLEVSANGDRWIVLGLIRG